MWNHQNHQMYVHILTVFLVSLRSVASYTLLHHYNTSNFFERWNYMTNDDYSHGYVNYVNQSHAQEKGYMTIVPNGVRGRDSIRIESKETYNSGLFIFDIDHMPTGCGTWPALWLYGSNWPYNGEIDIIEGANLVKSNQVTLHTGNACTMSQKRNHTGVEYSNNCTQSSGFGCAVSAGRSFTYGSRFNERGGGIYTMLWDDTGIRIWFLFRTQFNYLAKIPKPETWGIPQATFPFTPSCPKNNFINNTLVINIDFCGDWAGTTFPIECKGDCATFVKNDPLSFNEAYWTFRDIKVYSIN